MQYVNELERIWANEQDSVLFSELHKARSEKKIPTAEGEQKRILQWEEGNFSLNVPTRLRVPRAHSGLSHCWVSPWPPALTVLFVCVCYQSMTSPLALCGIHQCNSALWQIFTSFCFSVETLDIKDRYKEKAKGKCNTA